MSITTQLQQLLRTLLPDKGFKTAGHHRDAIIAGVEEAKTYTDEKVSEVNGYTDQEVLELKTYTDTELGTTVKKTGNETIGGVKTFTSAPVVPDATLPQHPVALNQGVLKTQIKQTIGTSESDLMSQKAISTELLGSSKIFCKNFSELSEVEKNTTRAIKDIKLLITDKAYENDEYVLYFLEKTGDQRVGIYNKTRGYGLVGSPEILPEYGLITIHKSSATYKMEFWITIDYSLVLSSFSNTGSNIKIETINKRVDGELFDKINEIKYNDISAAYFSDTDEIHGCDVNTSGVGIIVSSGIVNGKVITGKTINLTALSSPSTRVINNVSILNNASYYLPGTQEGFSLYPSVISVIDSTSSYEYQISIDYTIVEHPSGYRAIKNITGAAITVNINFTEPKSRFDSVIIDKSTGTISVYAGYESNGNPTMQMWDYAGVPSNYRRIATIFRRWNSSELSQSDIYNVKNRNIYGENIDLFKILNNFNSEKWSSLNFQLAMNNLATSKFEYNTDNRVARIGILGDSRTSNDQSQLIDLRTNTSYGWVWYLADLINSKIKIGFKAYFQQDNTPALSVKRDFNSTLNTRLELINYAKGGHQIHEWLHSSSGYYDINSTNRCSLKYRELNTSNKHDLFIIAPTNNFEYLQLINSNSQNYYNNYGSTAETLYEVMTKLKVNGGHYELTLHSQLEYGNGSTLQQKQYLINDAEICYIAMIQRIIEELKTQNKNVEIIIITGFHDGIRQVIDGFNDSFAIQSMWLKNIAKENYLRHVDISELFINPEYLGIDKFTTMLPEGNIHPCVIIHRAIAKIIYNNLGL